MQFRVFEQSFYKLLAVMRNVPHRTFPRNRHHEKSHKIRFRGFCIFCPNIKVSPSSFTFLKKGKEN